MPLSAYVHNFTISSGQLAPSSLLVLSSQGSIESLTPCVLCLKQVVEQILPRCALPAAPAAEFSITSHIHDTLWWVLPREQGREGGYRVSEMRAAKLGLRAVSHTHTQLLYLRCFQHCDCGGVSTIPVHHHHFPFLINIILQ